MVLRAQVRSLPDVVTRLYRAGPPPGARDNVRYRRVIAPRLRDRTLTDEDNQRLLNGLGARDDQGHLMRFLEAPFVEPTNNRAERILRPAVIARKVSRCSKNQEGAEAFAAFQSIAQTAVKNGAASVASAFRALFAGANASPNEQLPS